MNGNLNQLDHEDIHVIVHLEGEKTSITLQKADLVRLVNAKLSDVLCKIQGCIDDVDVD